MYRELIGLCALVPAAPCPASGAICASAACHKGNRAAGRQEGAARFRGIRGAGERDLMRNMRVSRALLFYREAAADRPPLLRR